MIVPADVGRLLYCLPDDPNTTHTFILQNSLTCLGRMVPDLVESTDVGQLHLNLPTISAQHARIVQTEVGYVLQNWRGRHGIGLYERELLPGESHVLSHCDIFRIPARAEHVRLQFLVTQQQTQSTPLEVDHAHRKVYVFGERMRLTPLEYRLIAHLHQHAGQVCSYSAVMMTLWSDAHPFERKGNLEVLLHDLRAKLRTASGGFTFLETVHGQGIRLVV